MDLGTVVFYRNKKEFDSVLDHMKVKPQSLSIEDSHFKEFYGYDRQSLFHVLYQSDNMWGFVASKINRKDGTIGWKVINADNKVSQVNDSEIYFALKMDSFSYTHWAEMEDKNTIKKSPHGSRIMKKPSNSSVKKAKVVKNSYLPEDKMLYQIISLSNGNPQYPSSNPFNSQWDKYQPFNPPQNPYPDLYKSMNRSQPPYYPQERHYWTTETTFHAVPFLRDNIKPSTFSVVRKMKSPTHDLRMFINFPKGIPINFG